MPRYLTKKIKELRRNKNSESVKDIYRKGASTVPLSSLVVHQEASKETKAKILAAAQARRQQRAQRNRD